ncbi:non-ltr retrotransposon cats, partial [Lasius niger]
SANVARLIYFGEPTTLAGVSLTSQDVLRKLVDLRSVDEYLSLQWDKSLIPKTSVSYYTDGSKLDGKVGCALVRVESARETHAEMHRLSDNTTVFVAEMLAILQALKHAKSENIQSADIFTDSMSSLMALRSLDIKSVLAEEVKDFVRKHGLEVHFHWVKAHAGIKFNELVDGYAKQATTKVDIDYAYPRSRCQIKRLAKSEMLSRWQERWDSEIETGRKIYEVFPRVSESRLQGDFFVNQFISGHGIFLAYQERFHSKDPTCLCNGERMTPDHCIARCIRLRDEREALPYGSLTWQKNRFFTDYYCRMGLVKMGKKLFEPLPY